MKIIINKSEFLGDTIEIEIYSHVNVKTDPPLPEIMPLDNIINFPIPGIKKYGSVDSETTGATPKRKYLKSTKMKDLKSKKEFVVAVTERANENKKKNNLRGRKFRKFTPEFHERVQALKAKGKTSFEVAEELWAELELVNRCWQ